MKTWSFLIVLAFTGVQDAEAQGLSIRRDRNSLVITYRGAADKRPDLYGLACAAVEEVVKTSFRPAQYGVVREYGGPGFEKKSSFASFMLSDFFSHHAIAKMNQSDIYWFQLIRVTIWLTAPWIAPNADRDEDTILYALGGAAAEFARKYGSVL